MKAAANIKEAQKVAAERWTDRIRSRTFKPGDLVMLRTHRRTDADKGIHKKFLDRWEGPATIVETSRPIINCQVVEITRRERKETVVVNIKNIKPYHKRPEWMSVDIPHSDPLFSEEITPEQLQGDAPIRARTRRTLGKYLGR